MMQNILVIFMVLVVVVTGGISFWMENGIETKKEKKEQNSKQDTSLKEER